MAQPLDQFVKQLTLSTLLSGDDVAAFLAGLSRQPPDGDTLARELVRQKKLTAFQAQQIYAGKGKTLVLGNYVILEKLGQGGMGMVLKAEHRRMERLVALKVLSPAVVKTPEALRRFQREVKAAARLTHPNIVIAHDADEAGGTHFLVMEFVDGADLSSLVKKSGPLPLEKALACLIQAARGLEYAHSQGIVHRDIKPANLLLDSKGTIKILDMGLARLDSAGARQDDLTGTGQIMGTVDYMAPEQAANTKNADHRADIYSLGVTLWFLLTGKAMYDGETVIEKLLAHQSKPIPQLPLPLGEGWGEGSAKLDAVFQKMVAKSPTDRYPSMTEVIAALEKCRSGGGTTPTVSLGPSDDSKLNSFLKGQGSAGTRGAKGTATAAKHATSPAFEETLNTSPPSVDTDPTTNLHIAAAKNLAAKPARDNRQLILYGSIGAGMLSLVGVVAIGLSFLGGGNAGKATRQKGKPTAKTSIPVGSASTVASAPAAWTDDLTPVQILTSPDWDWTEPENLGPLVNSPGDDGRPSISADGLKLIFMSDRPGGLGNYDLWQTTRKSTSDPWSAPVNLGSPVNQAGIDVDPCLSVDGRQLFFTRDEVICQTRWSDSTLKWSEPEVLDATINTGREGMQILSSDGRSLLFATHRTGGHGSADVWMSSRNAGSTAWPVPKNLGAMVNSQYDDVPAAISSDERVLIICRGVFGVRYLYMSSRASKSAEWSPMVQLPPNINATRSQWDCSLTSDGQTMVFDSYFRKGGMGMSDLWVVHRVPKQIITNTVRPPSPSLTTPMAGDMPSTAEMAQLAISGEWLNEGGAIVSPVLPYAQLALPGKVPASYKLTLEVTREAGTGPLVIGLPVAGKRCVATIDNSPAAAISATPLHEVTIGDFPTPAEVKYFPGLVRGQPVRIEIEITEHPIRISIAIDGKPVLNHVGNLSSATTPARWQTTDPNVPFIGASLSRFRITKLEVGTP